MDMTPAVLIFTPIFLPVVTALGMHEFSLASCSLLIYVSAYVRLRLGPVYLLDVELAKLQSLKYRPL